MDSMNIDARDKIEGTGEVDHVMDYRFVLDVFSVLCSPEGFGGNGESSPLKVLDETNAIYHTAPFLNPSTLILDHENEDCDTKSEKAVAIQNSEPTFSRLTTITV